MTNNPPAKSITAKSIPAESTTAPSHLIVDASLMRRWVICESGHRWATAVRRFVTQLMPDDLVASIASTHFADERHANGALSDQRRVNSAAIILWEVTADNLAEACELIAETSISSPEMLQLAATESLSDAEIVGLTELGVSATVQQPEQMPRLTRLIHVYFRESA